MSEVTLRMRDCHWHYLVLKWFVERIYKRKSNFKMLKGVIQERKSGLKTMTNVTKDIL